MATHWLAGVPVVNWVITQRWARSSQIANGSPALVVWHGPPKPAKKELPAVGPDRRLPVALSKTAQLVLIHSM